MDFTIEELSMNAWPSIQTVLYNGWIIRMAKGYTKRANSINPIYNFSNNLEEKIKYCENLYAQNNLPVIFKIIECEEHKFIDSKLETLGYGKIDITSVQVCNKIKIQKENANGIIISNGFNNDWINGFINCNKINENHTETIKIMLSNIIGYKIIVSKKINDEIVGCGYGVMENEFVGLFDIAVSEDKRGNGYGKEIVKTILSEADKNGIRKSYLQVVNNNTIAKKLYENIGYSEKYKYWYRIK